jgi:hypothetical protein
LKALANREAGSSINASARRDRLAVLLAAATLVVLVLAYMPIVRAHQGWEDEAYWTSTCLSMLRHKGGVPSVLADFPSPISPLRFYGPTLFWLGAAALKIFGFSMLTWRTFTFVGTLGYLASIGVLFYRLRRSRLIAAGAVLFSSLSIGMSFGISLPGRPDSWTIAMVVLALAIAATEQEDGSSRNHFAERWIGFGVLLGTAASTTPRVWPLLALMVVLMPLLLIDRRRLHALALVLVSASVIWSVILLPLRTTIWSFVSAVRHASAGDQKDVSPLMGGSWGFGHSQTQILYYGALLLVIALVYLPRWRETGRFQRWLLVVSILNLLANLALTARSLNMIVYWGPLLEIAALCAWTEPLRGTRMRWALRLGLILFVYMVALRAAREWPPLAHWRERNPDIVLNELRAVIPSGSLTYGLPGRYLFPSLSIGAEYRVPVDWSSVGRASTPGQPNLPSPMRDACRVPAYLIWPHGTESEPLPPLPYTALQHVASYVNPPEHRSALERMVERVPGGRSGEDWKEFVIYRLLPNSEHCNALGVSLVR